MKADVRDRLIEAFRAGFDAAWDYADLAEAQQDKLESERAMEREAQWKIVEGQDLDGYLWRVERGTYELE